MINKYINDNKKLSEFLFLIIFVYLLISVIYFIGFIYIENFSNVLLIDSKIYYQMALSPFNGNVAPYSYRLLTPLLVNILPINHMIGFKLINLTTNGLTAILLYYFLKKLEFSKLVSLIGITIFLITPTILYTTYDIVLVDSLSFLFILGAFYAILIKNDYLYFLMMILGLLNKETVLFSLPLYLVYKYNEKGTYNALKWFIYISIPLITIYISLRYFFGHDTTPLMLTMQQNINYHFNSNNILNNPYLAFGTMWLIFLYCLKNIKSSFLKKSLITLPFIFLQFLIASDSFRVLFIAFPIIIPISLYIFQTDKKNVVLILMCLSLSLTVLYCLLTLNSEKIIGFLALPLEIFLSGCLLSYYRYLSKK